MSDAPHPHPAHEAEERFRLLVESVTDYAIFMLEPDGRVASWNAGAERLKGYSASDIIGQHFSRFYSPADLAAQKPQRELEIASTEGRVQDEGWRLRKDGSRFWALVVITAMRDRHRRLVGFAKVTRDLTERRAAEERLRASEEQFRMLVDRVEEYAIYLLAPTGHVVTWNSGAEKIKQYSAQEIIGKSFACFYTAKDVTAGKPQFNLQEASRLGHVREHGVRVRKDGSCFEADVVITALRDDTGTLRGFSKVTRDITDQVRSRELEAEKLAAERSSKAKDEFLAVLSHELRTPLTPALAAAGFLVENSASIPAEFGPELEVIRRNVQLEARLIDDLLDLTRISAGKIALHADRIDAHAVARDAIQIVRPDVDEKGLRLIEELSAAEHHLWGDPVRIQQVFWNVLSNAVKFTRPGGDITIRTCNEEGQFVFEIIDTGIGVEPERQQRLFKAFEQGESGVTRQFGGLGLGLAICKNLVELHGGTIELASRGRNFGTTVKVVFDALTDSVSDTETGAPAPTPPSAGLRILLVEDHDDTRRTLQRLLTHSGHQLSIAVDVETAIKRIESESFDLVLSDIGLPDGTGHQVISAAKRLQDDVTGVALSGFGMSEDVRRSEDAGFDFHLTKPIDYAQLRKLLGTIQPSKNRVFAPAGQSEAGKN